MKKILVLFLSLSLFSCGSDMVKGLNIVQNMSKKYDCFEPSFSINYSGNSSITLKSKCMDTTGFYEGKAVLDFHKAFIKEKIIASRYLVEINETSTKEYTARELNQAMKLEELAYQLKKDFCKKNFESIYKHSSESLISDLKVQDFFKKYESRIAKDYPLDNSYRLENGFVQFGFEKSRTAFLLLIFDPEQKKLVGINFN